MAAAFAARDGDGDAAMGASGGTSLELSAVDAAIAQMEAERRRALEEQAATQSALVPQTQPWAPLPVQGGESKALHALVVDRFEVRHNLKPKELFLLRKQKRQLARRARKARDVEDKRTFKVRRVLDKRKLRKEARSVY
jgi:hypothetical protein